MPICTNPAEREQVLAYFAERFGVPKESFQNFRLLKEGKTIWIVADGPGLDEVLERLKIEMAGIPLLRLKAPRWKPTTAGLHLLDRQATRNGIDLDDLELNDFLAGKPLSRTWPAEPGYVIVRWKGRILGCGLYRREELRSQIPRRWRSGAGSPGE